MILHLSLKLRGGGSSAFNNNNRLSAAYNCWISGGVENGKWITFSISIDFIDRTQSSIGLENNVFNLPLTKHYNSNSPSCDIGLIIANFCVLGNNFARDSNKSAL